MLLRTRRLARGCALLALLAAFVSVAPRARCDEPPPSLEALTTRFDDAQRASSQRVDDAEALAESHFEPERLVPWLRSRLQAETDLHLRLALAYALAAQGELDGVRVLVASLQETGHLGYVYLRRVSEEDFGRGGEGWNAPAWEAWLTKLEAPAWRELQRRRHLPRVPLDADAAGLAQAMAWWDDLGYPDVGTLPFVRVVDGWMQVGDERRDSWDYAFLLHEDASSLTVFATDLTKRTHLRAGSKGAAPARVEPSDIAEDVRGELEARRGSRISDHWARSRDAFGVDYMDPARPIQGLVLARALAARGHQDLALAVWKHVAERPGLVQLFKHGPWSALDLIQHGTRYVSKLAWEAEARDPATTWPQALAAFKLHRKRFDVDGSDAAFEEVLARMALEAPRYDVAALSVAADPAERARDLVFALPTVARSCTHSGEPALIGGAYRGSGWDEPEPSLPPDALDGLIALGPPAVPALRAALDDRRLTKSVARYAGYTKGWMRHDPEPVHVATLALHALHQITLRDFADASHLGGSEAWARIGARVDAWWALYQAQGERAVLEEGVRRKDRAAPAQARRLVAHHPGDAFKVVREAAEGAEAQVKADLLEAMAPLAQPEVQAYLRAQVRSGPLPVRMAAAEALHGQGIADGLDALLAEWPACSEEGEDPRFGYRSGWDLDRFVALCFRLDASRSAARFRAMLPATGMQAKFRVIGRVHVGLGHSEHGVLEDPPPRKVPPEALEAVEALVIAMVLDEGRREGQHFTLDGRETNRVGEHAAATAALLWPARYRFAEAAPAREKHLARHGIVNTWRARHGLPSLAAPEFAHVEPLAAATIGPLIEAWLAAPPGDPARAQASDALLAAGLGALPALRSARNGLAEDDARRKDLDALVRRMAVIAREVAWAPGSLVAPPAFAALADEVRGKPVTGAWITGLWRALARGKAGEATCLDLVLTRPGDDTGAVVVLTLSSATTPWEGAKDGWVVAGSGWEHVYDSTLEAERSWWHDCRGPQLDEVLLVAEDREVEVRRTLTRVR